MYFVMPAAGGVPRRLTYHPGQDGAVGWTPDGKRVLFVSSRAIPNDGARLYTLAAGGRWTARRIAAAHRDRRDRIPPDGSHLAYVPLFQWQQAWKRYRGGQTRKIWIANLADSSIVKIPRDNSNDFNPMWVGDRIYFLSDREGPVDVVLLRHEDQEGHARHREPWAWTSNRLRPGRGRSSTSSSASCTCTT